MVMTRLNSVEILEGIKHHLETTLVPELQTEPARVTAQMLGDLLETVQRRITNEAVWLAEETDIMLGLLEQAAMIFAGSEAPPEREATAAITRAQELPAPSGYDAVDLGLLQKRYAEISAALETVIRAAGLSPEPGRLEQLVQDIRRYLLLRSDREIVIAGDRPMRGRG